jgi:hypothetical protein
MIIDGNVGYLRMRPPFSFRCTVLTMSALIYPSPLLQAQAALPIRVESSLWSPGHPVWPSLSASTADRISRLVNNPTVGGGAFVPLYLPQVRPPRDSFPARRDQRHKSYSRRAPFASHTTAVILHTYVMASRFRLVVDSVWQINLTHVLRPTMALIGAASPHLHLPLPLGLFVALCAVALAAYVAATNLVSWRRLNHVPGPPGAGWSKWWMLRNTLGGSMHVALERACNKYGECTCTDVICTTWMAGFSGCLAVTGTSGLGGLTLRVA